MAYYVVYSDHEHTKQANGANAIIVDASDEADARVKAAAACPPGTDAGRVADYAVRLLADVDPVVVQGTIRGMGIGSWRGQ